MAQKVGLDCKLYVNDGSYAVPDWTEVDIVRDATLNVEKGDADGTSRRSGRWRATLDTLKDASVDAVLVYDTDDENFVKFQEAFFDDTTLEVAVMDGDIDVADSQGLRMTVRVASFSQPQNLEDAVVVNISLKPSASAANNPEWITIDSTAVKLSFTMTLAAGVATLDLTAIPYGAGTYDGTGKIVTALNVVNNGGSALSFTEGVANGYDLFGMADTFIVGPSGGLVKVVASTGGAIGAEAKEVDLTGATTQTSTWTLTLEDA